MAEDTLYFEDVAEGDEAPVRSHPSPGPIWSTTPEPRATSIPCTMTRSRPKRQDSLSVFGHGMFSMGLLGSAITDYVGPGNVRRFLVRFAKQTWPDEELAHGGWWSPTNASPAATTWSISTSGCVNADGEEKVVGEATAVVPSVLTDIGSHRVVPGRRAGWRPPRRRRVGLPVWLRVGRADPGQPAPNRVGRANQVSQAEPVRRWRRRARPTRSP